MQFFHQIASLALLLSSTLLVHASPVYPNDLVSRDGAKYIEARVNESPEFPEGGFTPVRLSLHDFLEAKDDEWFWNLDLRQLTLFQDHPCAARFDECA